MRQVAREFYEGIASPSERWILAALRERRVGRELSAGGATTSWEATPAASGSVVASSMESGFVRDVRCRPRPARLAAGQRRLRCVRRIHRPAWRAEELREPFRAHRRAAIGVHGELSGLDAVAGDSLREEVLGELRALVLREQPADRHATEEVEDGIQAVEHSGERAAQLGDIPGPDLVGCRGQERRLRVLDRSALGASLAGLAMGGENAVHRADRRDVTSSGQQRCVDLVRRLVDELVAVKHVEQALLFGVAEAARTGCALMPRMADTFSLARVNFSHRLNRKPDCTTDPLVPS